MEMETAIKIVFWSCSFIIIWGLGMMCILKLSLNKFRNNKDE